MKNKAFFAVLGIFLLILIGWMNAYDYKVVGTRAIYRINRLTHQVDVAKPHQWHWKTIEGSGWNIFANNEAVPDT